MMSKDVIYCDNCAVPLDSEQEQNVWSESPIDFDSGNKGESAVFCNDCNYGLRSFVTIYEGVSDDQ